ncbi:MAG: hypothetical protein KA371_20980 [Acidobacteria bacterium]|nr:hypothetical protein [Acidobacteriota bacterium]
MTFVNAQLVRVSDLLLAPLAGLSPLVVVTGTAFASALLVLAVMRLTSDQPALTAAKRRIHAALLEMRLYNDDLPAILRAQGEALRHNLSYVGLSLVPLLITAVPLTFAIAQLQAWYGYAGLTPGAPVVVTAVVDGPRGNGLPHLEADGLDQQGPPRYFPALGEVTWRVVPRAAGASTLRIVMPGGAMLEKSLDVAAGDVTARRSPVRQRATLVGQLLYPSEPPLEDTAGVSAIRVPYPDRSLAVFGAGLHWLYIYVAATFAFVLLLRKPLGVVI